MRMIGIAEVQNGLYVLPFPVYNKSLIPSIVLSVHTPTLNVCTFDLWHHRLGHFPCDRISLMNKDFPYVQSSNSNKICDVCHFSKQKKLPFSLSDTSYSQPLDLLHADIWGPIAVPSIQGHKYFLTLVDDHTRHTWVYLMKNKSEVHTHLKRFLVLIENLYGFKLKRIRTDNGPEFLLRDFYAQNGILHQTSCVETPQQNARVERKHQHILNVTRSLLF